MSGDDLRRVATGEAVGDSHDERLTPLVDSTRPRPRRDRPRRDAGNEAIDAPFDEGLAGGQATVDDGLVTQSLDEILLALIALTDDETHGTVLMEALESQFEADLSPGTVYPRLHELDSAGILEMHELVQTKQYSIDDRQEAERVIERAMYEHLAMSRFLQAALDEL
jgi:DNA-binding PadR family transcriptional regulator